VFLLIPAHPGSPRQRAVKRLLLLCVTSCDGFLCKELAFWGRYDCTCVKILVALIF